VIRFKRIAIIGLPFLLAVATGAESRPLFQASLYPLVAGVSQPLFQITKPVYSTESLSILSLPLSYITVSDRSAPQTKALGSPSEHTDLLRLIEQGNLDEALVLLQKMIKNRPNDLNALTLLGTLHYKKDELNEAIAAWEKVVKADPQNNAVLAYLDKARRELGAHSGFTREMTRHFTIKFDGAENRHLYQTVMGILEDAYGEIGRTLYYFPTQEVIVYLYTNQQFFDVTRAPAWSGGIFDGKIRIPSKGFEDKIDALKRILTHEYVHAVVYQITQQEISEKTGRRAVQVPTWLNEGIAQYLEFSKLRDGVKNRMKERVKQGIFIKLSALHGSFMGLDAIQAGIAYEESLSAVSFLIDEFGIWRFKMLLEDLATKGNIEEAISSALLVSYDQFQYRWEASLM